ncbi:MAG: 50S ribosomal protein L17 [Candidatus Colwellbacteria bacterium]|nr:50S ribosomal protein L17 [Candidatus Colwellbacteria bacterium]
MRHARQGRKFGRKKGQRRSFITGLVHNLIMQDKITTTEARAKEMKSRVEKLVTIARKNDLAALRLLERRLPKASAYRLYHEVAPRYKNKRGGYVRVKKMTARRKRDNAPQAIIEFV